MSLVCKQYLAERQAHDPDFSYSPVILGSDNPQCDADGIKEEVQRKATLFMMAINLTTGILSAIVAPKLGHLSDRYGRTRLMALASVGGILNEIMTILAAKFSNTIDYRWLVLGATFDGLTGSFTAGSILSQSYTSDCTPPSKRSVSMGYIHACLFTGLAFGPLLAGQFVKWTGSLLTIFYVVLGCHIFFMLFVALVVPESVSKRRRLLATEIWLKQKKTDKTYDGSSLIQRIQNAHPFRPLAVLWPKHHGVSSTLRRNLVALAITDVIIMGSMIALGGVMVYYTELIFGWHTVEKSRFISALSMVRVFVLMVILPIINYFGRTRPAARKLRETGGVPEEKRAGADKLDIWILRFAIISDVVGSVGYATSRSPAPFLVSGAITAFGGLGSATIQAVVTKHVPQERVGQILGAIGMLHALARVALPLMFSSLYAATLKTFPQAVFVLLCCLFVVALVSSLLVKPHGKSSIPCPSWHNCLL